MGEENTEAAVAEQPQEQAQEHVQEHSQAQTQEEEKQVPLKALQAERRKRQEAEYQAKWMQEQLQSAQSNPKAQASADDDGDELLTKSDFTKMSQSQLAEFKRQTLEESFVAQNPEIMDVIETDLPEILKKKPWLAHAINNSSNRYQTAYEVIKDYRPKTQNIKQKIAENSEKPGSPAGVGKSGQVGKDYAKMSKNDFREYRKQLLQNKR